MRSSRRESLPAAELALVQPLLTDYRGDAEPAHRSHELTEENTCRNYAPGPKPANKVLCGHWLQAEGYVQDHGTSGDAAAMAAASPPTRPAALPARTSTPPVAT